MPLLFKCQDLKKYPNIGGMKCYKKQGFRVVPVPPLERSDGPNFYMVCEPKSDLKRNERKRSVLRRNEHKRRSDILLLLIIYDEYMFLGLYFYLI